jgi:hypothetical protein
MEGERWWIARSHSGRERLLEWAAQQVAETRREDLGTFSWDITGRQVPAMNSTTMVQMTTNSDLYEVRESLRETATVWQLCRMQRTPSANC